MCFVKSRNSSGYTWCKHVYTVFLTWKTISPTLCKMSPTSKWPWLRKYDFSYNWKIIQFYLVWAEQCPTGFSIIFKFLLLLLVSNYNSCTSLIPTVSIWEEADCFMFSIFVIFISKMIINMENLYLPCLIIPY